MQGKLEDILDNDERILWQRLPGAGLQFKALRTIQLAGHILLSAISLIFAFYTPLSPVLRIILGLLLIISTNAPLLAWSRYRLPELDRRIDALFFLTDKRVGILRQDGEMLQAPICPGLSVTINMKASMLEFSLGERTPVRFGGLKKEDILLVGAVAEGLIEKCK